VVDGALWSVVDEGLARMDLATETVVTIELGGGAFPGSGSPLWATRYDTGDLIRIDTTTGEPQLTIANPGGVAEGPSAAAGFDSVWVGGSNRVYRLDPASGAVIAEIETAVVARLLVSATGVWVTSYDRGVVERIDPATNQVVFRAQLGGNPNGIAEGLGSIWVADTGRGLMFRIDPAAVGLSD
jgi:streptogramin lyase